MEPSRQFCLRRAAFQVHLWAGLVLGLYIAVMSATGVFLLFADEIEEALYPQLYRTGSSSGQPATITAIARSAAAAYPDRTVAAVYAPSHARQTVIVYLKRGDDVLYAYLDPVTTRVLAEATASSSIVRWIRELHFNLFSGRTGRAVNGIGGLALFLVALTGVLTWWPGIGKVLRGLSFRLRPGRKRFTRDVHSAVGIWSAAAVAMWGITGFYFGHAAAVQSAIHRISPLSQVEPPASKPRADRKPVDVQSLVEDAVRRSPGAFLYGVQMPANPRAAYIVFLSPVRNGEKRHTSYHYFDQYTGDYLGAWHRGRPASLGDKLITLVVPLHFGSFGGTPVKLLWAALGIMPFLLFATAAIMWWNRVARPRLRSVPPPGSSERAPAAPAEVS